MEKSWTSDLMSKEVNEEVHGQPTKTDEQRYLLFISIAIVKGVIKRGVVTQRSIQQHCSTSAAAH